MGNPPSHKASEDKGGEKFMKMNTIGWVAWLLVVVGAINWGLIGAFNYNLVAMVLGMGTIAQLVYILVGVSGLYLVWMAFTKKGKK
jgi:uncharacterized membrane protein YuzA (DUF378 family)